MTLINAAQPITALAVQLFNNTSSQFHNLWRLHNYPLYLVKPIVLFLSIRPNIHSVSRDVQSWDMARFKYSREASCAWVRSLKKKEEKEKRDWRPNTPPQSSINSIMRANKPLTLLHLQFNLELLQMNHNPFGCVNCYCVSHCWRNKKIHFQQTF